MSETIPPNAVDWNNFFNLAAIIALVALSVVVGFMIYFTVQYRERKGSEKVIPPKRLGTRARDAMIFAVISIIILFSVTVAGDRLTPNARFQPAIQESYVIEVHAFQWDFRYTYPTGAASQHILYVPANTVIMFNVTSDDVMHNFYLEQFRVSIDAIPGRYNIIWITTPPVTDNSTLNYRIVCKELCGTGHTTMNGPMYVMSQSDFSSWLANQTAQTIPGTTGGG